MHRIVCNVSTGEITQVDLTAEEIAIIEAEKIVFEQEKTRLETERIALEQAQATAKASAIAKLTALGLSAEEISAIGA
jgi:hypothetical protein